MQRTTFFELAVYLLYGQMFTIWPWVKCKHVYLHGCYLFKKLLRLPKCLIIFSVVKVFCSCFAESHARPNKFFQAILNLLSPGVYQINKFKFMKWNWLFCSKTFLFNIVFTVESGSPAWPYVHCQNERIIYVYYK